ncbi:MAG: hypothetical protein CL850_01365, partial [Crocinitomicaceae bacterium]|nr:hypothetical protein [Crocinitomicaceae bacterium]
SFPEVNSVDLKILSSLGALYTGENLSLSGIVQVSDRTIPWVIKSIYKEGDGRMVVYAEIIPQFLRMSFERV